jgi:hypothetical protein
MKYFLNYCPYQRIPDTDIVMRNFWMIAGSLGQVEEERASLEQRLTSGQLQLAKLEKKVPVPVFGT